MTQQDWLHRRQIKKQLKLHSTIFVYAKNNNNDWFVLSLMRLILSYAGSTKQNTNLIGITMMWSWRYICIQYTDLY